jgi:hypothetical protein
MEEGMANWSERNEAARQWLIRNDPEGAYFWAIQPNTSDFIAAKEDNIRDFGPDMEDQDFLELGDSFV